VTGIADDDLADFIRSRLPRSEGVDPAEDAPAQLRARADHLEQFPAQADVVLVVLSSPRRAKPEVRVLGRPVSTRDAAGLLLQSAVQVAG
jgi:hypothetical protein